jgi:carboxylesterase
LQSVGSARRNPTEVLTEIIMLTNKPFLLSGDPTHACLLLHGLGGGAYEMQGLGEHLNQLGLTVQGILYPGHDQPAQKMPRSRWQDWYAHSLQVYQTLAQTYARVSLVGFSTGCPLGLYLAAQHPVFKLVMLAPYIRLRSEWYYGLPLETYINTLGWLIQDVPRFRLPTFDPVREKEAREVAFFRTFNLAAVSSAMELIEQVKPQLPAIQAPTLIIQSPKDTVVDPAGATFLYNQLGTKDKQLYWLQTSDHIMTLDRERDVVLLKVGEFLQG